MQQPELSVIIPARQAGAGLAMTLARLAEQSAPAGRYEVIVASGEPGALVTATLQAHLSQPLPYSLHVVHAPGPGAARRRNAGARAARAAVLVFLDDDMSAGPGLLAAHCAAHAAGPSRVVIGYLPPCFEGCGGVEDWRRKNARLWWEETFAAMAQPGHRFAFTDLLSGNFSIDRALFVRSGGFDETLICREDYELGHRLLQIGANFVFCPEAWAEHRELMNVRRATARKRAEGQADVVLARLYPELTAELPLQGWARETRRPERTLRTLARRWPAAAEAAINGLSRVAALSERGQLLPLWHRVEGAMQGTAYWIGVWEAAEGPEEVQALLHTQALGAGVEPGDERMALLARCLGDVPPDRVAAPGRDEIAADRLRPATVLTVDLAAGWPGLAELVGRSERQEVLVKHRDRPLSWVRLPEQRTPRTKGEVVAALHSQLDAPAWLWLAATGKQAYEPGPAQPSVQVSVVVCTRNRADNLRQCLAALAAQKTPPHEIIVVDNAPENDSTLRVAMTAGVQYVCEPRPGLDFARNCGLATASGDVVAYVDDDAQADTGWVAAIGAAFAAEPVGLVTGPVGPAALDTPEQALFEWGYGGMSHGLHPRFIRRDRIDSRQLLWASAFGVGTNMAFRRQALIDVGGFDPALDVGGPARGGGDIEVLHRMVAKGHALRYEPAAFVWHQHRRTRDELRRQLGDNGCAFAVYLLTCARTGTVSARDIAGFAMLDWFYRHLLRRLARPGRFPRSLVWAEVWGALQGPIAYRQAQARIRRNFG